MTSNVHLNIKERGTFPGEKGLPGEGDTEAEQGLLQPRAESTADMTMLGPRTEHMSVWWTVWWASDGPSGCKCLRLEP